MNEDTIKVTQLPSAETITQNDLLMIVQNNENKKATSSQFVDMLDDELTNYYTKSETDDLLDDYTKTADLSAVAISGSYSDLSNKPTIPTKTSDLTNDSGFIDKDVINLTNYTKTTDLSSVATSGSYNDLSNKPDLSVYQLISNLTTTISSSSTDTQYPSAKCVYDIVGDINSALDTINGEVI